MTNQEAFNKVWDYFVTKRNPPAVEVNAVTGDSVCRYRSAVGPCAVGVLIPDEGYSEWFECNPVHTVLSMVRNRHEGLTDDQAEKMKEALGGLSPRFLQNLQSRHDAFAYLMCKPVFAQLSPFGQRSLRYITETYGERPDFWAYFRGEMIKLAAEFDLKVPA